MSTDRKVAIVTGASRWTGLGIALALGGAGYRVYVTGRTVREGDAALPGTVGTSAADVTAAGGDGIAVAVDDRDDAAIGRLVAQVAAESGRVDVLVNNVAAIHDELTASGPFWSKTLDLVDILDVGLRSHYFASWHVAPIMVREGRGLVVFTSSFGSSCYMHGPAYGAQKAGVDKFAADMGVDFRETGVAAVSLWMGPMLTERSRRSLAERPEQYGGFMAVAETPQFNGRLIDALARDPALAELNGQTLIGAELADRYGIIDEGGKRPPSYRDSLGSPRIPHSAIVA